MFFNYRSCFQPVLYFFTSLSPLFFRFFRTLMTCFGNARLKTKKNPAEAGAQPASAESDRILFF